MKAAFEQLKLDVAYPRERLNHWQRYCEEIGEPRRGLNQRTLAARLCHRLTQERAWEKCVKEGLSHQTLEKHLKLGSPFLRKMVLHDLWLSHRVGEDTWVFFGKVFLFGEIRPATW